VDIELIDAFYDTVKAGDQFDGFELLDMEQLWEIVKRLCADRVTRSVQEGNEVITWQRLDTTGAKRSIRCSFAPEFLIQIFDVETRRQLPRVNRESNFTLGVNAMVTFFAPVIAMDLSRIEEILRKGGIDIFSARSVKDDR